MDTRRDKGKTKEEEVEPFLPKDAIKKHNEIAALEKQIKEAADRMVGETILGVLTDGDTEEVLVSKILNTKMDASQFKKMRQKEEKPSRSCCKLFDCLLKPFEKKKEEPKSRLRFGRINSLE
ncbi:MAG: hypothetical protein A3F12_06650 [Gammaproteobacteria bacterium RIFCSPHIGHO2_12_FULL_38_14]|nr:MAG: hypothetical protein A3F12_06650 [Gammaproteobacteria bacterium RIFCSPHIGHO2_12_FULL_38_14]